MLISVITPGVGSTTGANVSALCYTARSRTPRCITQGGALYFAKIFAKTKQNRFGLLIRAPGQVGSIPIHQIQNVKKPRDPLTL